MALDKKRLLQRLRVPLGLASAILFLVFAKPDYLWLTMGAAIAFVGVSIRGWASGHIRKAVELATSGPYAYTRNPLYLGSFLIALGFAVASGVWWLAAGVTILFALVYFPVMRTEADDIRAIFGEQFDEYQQNVPLFFPRLTPWKKSGRKFDFQLYLKHREYQAALGLSLAIGLLFAKLYFRM